MDLKQLKQNWEDLGESDPYWAVLTRPDKINNRWNKAEFYQSGKSWVKRLFQTFQLENQLAHKEVALDFGCGPGRLTQGLCGYFEQVIGVDISSSMIRLAQSNNQFPDSCTYLTNDGSKIESLPSNHFDFVLSFITLQHIEKRFALQYLKEFERVLKSGGVLLFNLPCKPPLFFRVLNRLIGFRGMNILRRLYYGKKSVIEMHWMAEKEVISFVKSIGLVLIQIEQDFGAGRDWESNFYLLRKR